MSYRHNREKNSGRKQYGRRYHADSRNTAKRIQTEQRHVRREIDSTAAQHESKAENSSLSHGITRDSNRGRRVLIPSALTTTPLSHTKPLSHT